MDVYLPRDEAFLRIKQVTLLAKTFYSMINGLKPALEAIVPDTKLHVPHLSTTDDVPNKGTWNLNTLLPKLIDFVVDKGVDILPLASSENFGSKSHKLPHMLIRQCLINFV